MPRPTFDPGDFGAKYDGRSDDSIPLLDAISRVQSAGGGHLQVSGPLAYTRAVAVPAGVQVVYVGAGRLVPLSGAAVSGIAAPYPARSASTYLHLPPGWDDAWVAAKAACLTTPTWMTVVADSRSSGVGTSNATTKPWLELVRTQLLANYPLYGDCWHSAHSASWWTAVGQTFPGTAPWTFPTAPIWGGGNGYGVYPVWGGALAQNMVQFATPPGLAPYTAVDMIYADLAAGANFGLSLDGVAQAAVTMTADRYQHRVSKTGLAAGDHTLLVTSESAGGACIPMAGCAYTAGGVGIGFARLYYPGANYADWGSVVGAPPDMWDQLAGTVSGGATTFGFPAKMGLLVVELGANDLNNGYGLDGATENAYRATYAAKRTGASVLLWLTYHTSAMWPAFAERLRHLADHMTCGAYFEVAEYATRGPAWATSVTDPVSGHPNDLGHANFAARIGAIV